MQKRKWAFERKQIQEDESTQVRRTRYSWSQNNKRIAGWSQLATVLLIKIPIWKAWKKVKPCGWQLLKVKVCSCSARAGNVTHVKFINLPLLSENTSKEKYDREINLKQGKAQQGVAKVTALSGYQEPHQNEILIRILILIWSGTSDWKKMKMCGTKNLFALTASDTWQAVMELWAGYSWVHSLFPWATCTFCNAGPGPSYLEIQLHFISITCIDAVRKTLSLWMISVSSSHQNLLSIFQASQGRDFLCTLTV